MTQRPWLVQVWEKLLRSPEAIRKGKEDAMKKMITVSLDNNASVIHDVIGKFGSASVLLKNAPDGTGVIAGGPARAVIEMAGIKNIRTKSLGSKQQTECLYLLRSKALRTQRLRRMLQDFVENLLKRSWAKQTESVTI